MESYPNIIAACAHNKDNTKQMATAKSTNGGRFWEALKLKVTKYRAVQACIMFRNFCHALYSFSCISSSMSHNFTHRLSLSYLDLLQSN